jgi:NADH-quinone oxidoreductase subunit L
VFAESLLTLVFFWEGLLATTYGMIVIAGRNAEKTATKAVIISGVGDLCFIMGLSLIWAQTHTVLISAIHLPVEGAAAGSFVLLLIAALAKCGAMPFHSWIPDAAACAEAPFMVFLPASIEKLLGVYLLSRITLDLFQVTSDSWVTALLLTVGTVTLLFASLMAVVQTDYRRLLAFTAIGQVGFILLGIGSGTPIGIVGAFFHLINHATYKSCLFLCAGSIERQTNCYDLSQLGALRRRMPITCACFLAAAASGAGLPLFAGFFSKELIFSAAREAGAIYFLAAVLGSLLTTTALLKLGHAAFFGPAANSEQQVTEAPWLMLLPTVVTAACCLLFGLIHQLPIVHLVLPMVPQSMIESLQASGHHVDGWPTDPALIATSVIVMALAIIGHTVGVKLNGRASAATSHIRTTPGLRHAFAQAEAGRLDPYNLFTNTIFGLAKVLYRVDRILDGAFIVAGKLPMALSPKIRALHNGNTSTYLVWSLLAATLTLLYLGR